MSSGNERGKEGEGAWVRFGQEAKRSVWEGAIEWSFDLS